MCECGCGDFNASFKLKGPGDTWYSISIYPGCTDCDTPAGVKIGRHSADGAVEWGVPDLPDAEFGKLHDKDYDGQEAVFPIFHPSRLKAEIEKALEPLGDALHKARKDKFSDHLDGIDWEELIWTHGQRVRRDGE